MLKLARTLPVTVGATTKTLQVVRVDMTRHLRPLDPRATSPATILGREEVTLLVRSHVADFYDELMGATSAQPVPYSTVHFDGGDVQALMTCREVDEASRDDELLLSLLLLQVGVGAFDVGDDFELDNEHTYSGVGVQCTSVRPKPRLDHKEGD